jgi:predicted PurR-regulated permease PerM
VNPHARVCPKFCPDYRLSAIIGSGKTVMSQEPQRLLHDISWSALLKVVLLAAGIWLVVTLHEIVFFMTVVFIFVAAVNPTISFMQRFMSRTVAVSLFFVALLLLMVGMAYLFIPALVRQINDLIAVYPTLLEQARPFLRIDVNDETPNLFLRVIEAARTALDAIASTLIERGATFFVGLATFATGLVISFYLLLEEKNARDFFHQVLPKTQFQAVYTTVQKISDKMGYWIRGQLLIMTIVGAANFVIFSLIGLPSPLPLAIWSGLTELIPYVGPVLGILPALIVAIISENYLGALLVLIFSFLVIQQLESAFLVPRIMGKAVGLSPVLVILSLIIGVKLFGWVGAIIAVPGAAIISVIVQEWPQLRKVWSKALKEADGA